MLDAAMEVFNWHDIREEQVTPLQTRRTIHTPQATIVRLDSKKGASIPLHGHIHEQVTLLLSGAFRFRIQGRTVLLKPGDVLRVPSDVPHEAEVIEDSVSIEVFTPARTDWLASEPPDQHGKHEPSTK